MRKYLLVLALLASCAKQPIHPGAVNQVDSQLYDSIITLQAAIEEAKLQVPSLPRLKAPLNNNIIPAYNAVYDTYAEYHTALVQNSPTNPTTKDKITAQVTAILAALQAAITQAKVTK